MTDVPQKIEELQQKVREGSANMSDFFSLVRELQEIPGAARAQAKVLGELNREIFFATYRVFPLAAGVIAETAVLLLGISAGVFTWVRPLSTGVGPMLVLAQVLTVVSLHPLSHILAGRLMGIRFLGFYFDGPLKVEPGVKVEYESFLLRSHRERALFFFAGIIGTMVGAIGWLIAGYLYPFPGYLRAILALIAALLFLSEFLPSLFIKLGKPHAFGFSWYRGDLYKALRELKS